MTVTMAEVLNRNNPQRLLGLADFPNDQDFITHTAARAFGIMAETASPILEHYHSDLYHDAMFINRIVAEWDVDKPLVWMWSVNSTGTCFSSSLDTSAHREYTFRCTLYTEDRSYGTQVMFTMERL